MVDVFISYSRKDSDFVRKVHHSLTESGRDVWIDWEDIPLSANWWEEIKEGIEAADTFVFIISPHSVSSAICNFEVAHAIQYHKRIIPVIREFVDENEAFETLAEIPLSETAQEILGNRNLMHVARQSWAALARHNWLSFTENDHFGGNFDKLLEIIELDLEHTKAHTHFLVRALEWHNSGRDSSRLLMGTEIDEAEIWQAAATQKEPRPTQLHTEYIIASRARQRKQSRRLLGAITFALAVASVLAFLAVVQSYEANNNAATAAFNADLAATNEAIAYENAASATIAQGAAEQNAIAAATSAEIAQLQANAAATSAQDAIQNAATATIAQGRAEANGTRAANNAATAEANAQEAQRQANAAATSAQDAIQNAATATIAQGLAEFNRMTAVANAELAATARANSDQNAAEAETQAAIAERNEQIAIAAQEAVALERDRASAIALAAQAEPLLGTTSDPVGITLAIEALELYDVWIAERAVYRAIADAMNPDPVGVQQQPITAVSVSPDGSYLVIADESGAGTLWTVPEYEPQANLFAHTQAITGAYFSADSSRLLTTSADTTARVWDVASGTELQRLGEHTETIQGGAWSPDGSQVLTYSLDNLAMIWDVESGSVNAYLAHDGAVLAGAWSPDAQYIVTGAADGLARAWSPDGTLMHVYSGHIDNARDESEMSISTVAFSPDSQSVATGSSDETIHIWNPETGNTENILEAHVLDIVKIAWSPDGQYLVSSDGGDARSFTEQASTVWVWNMPEGEPHFGIFEHFGVVQDMAWSLDSSRLVTVGRDEKIIVWDAESGGMLVERESNAPLTTVAWLPDRSAFITGNLNGTVGIWPHWKSASDLLEIATTCCEPRSLTDEEARFYGLDVPENAPVPDELTSCDNGANPSRLYPGVRGRVLVSSDPTAVNVRNNPSVSASTILAQIPPGQTFRVIDGPICDEQDAIAWFQIRYGPSGLTGYVAEGLEEEYFLEPL